MRHVPAARAKLESGVPAVSITPASAKTIPRRYSALPKFEKRLLDLLAHPLVQVPLRPNRREAALLEYAERADVAPYHARIERPLGHLAQQRRERGRRDAPSPVGAPEPVAHLTLPVALEAEHVTGDLAVGDDRPSVIRLVRQDPLAPVRRERVVVTQRDTATRRASGSSCCS